MKLGARILKTGMAVVLALFVAQLFQLPSPVFAGISAVFAIQPSIYRSYLTIIEQIQGNLIGAALAFLFVYMFGNHFLVVGLAAIILIMLHLKLKIDNTISLSIVTLLVIMETPSDDFFTFAILRFATIMLGILAAFFINMIFFPPKYESKLYTMISDITNDVLRWVRITNHQAADHTLLKKEMEDLKERFNRVELIYTFFKDERKILSRSTQAKLRKLVLYRQMIATARKALEILQNMHQYDSELAALPGEYGNQIKEIIDHLIGNHEHLLYRHIGKAVQIHEQEMKEYEKIRYELLNLYKEYIQIENDQELNQHLLQFIAGILDYNEQLERLEILMGSLETYHMDELKKENKERTADV